MIKKFLCLIGFLLPSLAWSYDQVQVINTTNTPVNVAQTTFTIQTPNNNTTPIPISGSFSASTVNITTAAANAILPVAGVMVGGVSPTGQFQAFSTDVSSAIRISGTINSTSVQLSTSQFNTTFPGNGTAISFVGPTGLTQAARVTVSSDQWVNAMIVPSSNTVTISTGGVTVTGSVSISTASSASVIGSTIAVVNAQGTTLSVSGSLSASSVNITTATPNTALPIAGVEIGGVGPTGLFQAMTVDISSHPIVTISTGGVTVTQATAANLNATVTGAVSVSTGGVTAAQGPPSATDWRVTMSTNAVTGTVSISTGGVTSAQGPPGTADWHVTQSTNAVTGTVTISTGGVNATQGGTWTVNIATGGVGVTGAVSISTASTAAVGGSTIAVVNAQGTTLAISGTLSASSVNITTATANTALPIAGGEIIGVGPTGLAQVPRLTVSSDVWVNAMIVPSSNTVTISTGGVTAAQGPPGTLDWRVTMATANVYNVSIDTVIGQLADNGVAAGTNRLGTVPGIYQNTYLNGTAATQGRNAALSVGTDGNLWVSNQPYLRPPGFMTSTGTITAAASATDIACLYGNASNTVLVLGMRVSGTQTTAGVVQLDVIKRSAADVGVFSTMTVVAEDSTMNVGVSSTVWFTANPGTLGTAVGVVASYHLGVMATGTSTPNDLWISPASWRQRPIVLRGVAQGLCANLNSVTVTGGSFDVAYEYEEITTISP